MSLDSKGVDFGPWQRRLVSRVRRNWKVPDQATTLKGCVVISFRVLKDGSVVDVTDVSPSTTPAFTEAAHNAIVKSSPLEPLPADYADDAAVMTATFYYNDTPSRAGLTPAPPPPPPVISSQPEPTASPLREHGRSIRLRLIGSATTDTISRLRQFASGAEVGGTWPVEHLHSDSSGGSYCRGELSISGGRLVFRSENVSEGFAVAASGLVAVTQQRERGTFTLSFR